MHIGELIKQRVRDIEMSIDDFAKSLNIFRSGVYYIFDSDDILFNKLQTISKVLNFDFVSVLNDYSGSITALIETDVTTLLKMKRKKEIKIHKIIPTD